MILPVTQVLVVAAICACFGFHQHVQTYIFITLAFINEFFRWAAAFSAANSPTSVGPDDTGEPAYTESHLRAVDDV